MKLRRPASIFVWVVLFALLIYGGCYFLEVEQNRNSGFFRMGSGVFRSPPFSWYRTDGEKKVPILTMRGQLFAPLYRLDSTVFRPNYWEMSYEDFEKEAEKL